MTAQDFVEQLAELVRTAADGVSVEHTMAVAQMMAVHYRPWHHQLALGHSCSLRLFRLGRPSLRRAGHRPHTPNDPA
jgi:hypothetical protein